MKKILKFIAAASIIFSLANCQTEDLIGNQQIHQEAGNKSKITLATFKLETGIATVKPYTSVAISQGITGKVAPSDFVVDTISIRRHLSDIEELTYSFRIYPAFDEVDKSKKYNLVYRNVDNSWHTSIVTFKVQPDNSKITDFESLYDSRAASGWCTELVFSIECTSLSYCKDVCDGFGCPTGQCITVTSNTVPCGGGGGPSTGGGGTNPGGGGTNPGGGGTNPGAGVTNPNGGGSAPVNPYQFTPNMWENFVFDDPNYLKAVKAQLLYDYVSLINATQWVSENHATYMDILNWLLDDYTSKNAEFAKWAIDYFISNPNVTLDEFKNWYMGRNEGKDGEYFDPNLIVYDSALVQQPLPTLSQWFENFPKIGENNFWEPMQSSSVYQLVGGSIYAAHISSDPTIRNNYQNACAIRASRALLYSGINIPVLKYGNPPKQVTQKGADLKNYILAATSFNKFMIDKFGDTPHKLEGNDANDPQKVKNLLKGKNGIYVIINNNSITAGYSGHVDAIVDGLCISNAHVNPKGGVKSIRIWTLN